MQRKPLAFSLFSMVNTPLEQAVAARLVTDMDLLRLKASARVLARGLAPEIQWWDLLQEAFARVINGARRQPPDVPIVVFVVGVMRSIRAEYWRRRCRGEVGIAVPGRMPEALDPTSDPERALLAQEEIEALDKLFADDAVALQILTGLGDGLSAEEIRAEYGLTKKSYDTARKRIRRILLREGIRWKGP